MAEELRNLQNETVGEAAERFRREAFRTRSPTARYDAQARAQYLATHSDHDDLRRFWTAVVAALDPDG